MRKTASEKLAEQQNAQRVLIQYHGLKEPGARLATTYQSGKGQTDFIRVFVVGEDKRIIEITHTCAQAAGMSLARDKRSIAMRGGNYDKAFEVVSNVSYALGMGTYGLKHDKLLTRKNRKRAQKHVTRYAVQWLAKLGNLGCRALARQQPR